MKKSDLKFGDIVTTRNKKIWINLGEALRNEDRNWFKFDSVDNDLKNMGLCGHDWDIMRVQRYVLFHDNLYSLQTIYERKEGILDDKEKEYLSAVIKPFRDRVEYIRKNSFADDEYIGIELVNDCIDLPNFAEGTMYKGMEVDEEYTLEELGL